MKKLIFLLMVLIVFSSCQKRENYVVEYPELYTPEYCTNNYIQADPNLLYIAYADNSIGRIDVPGGYARYYAIKDVPIDDFLLLDEAIMFDPLSYKIVKNKYNLDLTLQDILSYKIKSVLTYSQSKDLDNMEKLVYREIFTMRSIIFMLELFLRIMKTSRGIVVFSNKMIHIKIRRCSFSDTQNFMRIGLVLLAIGDQSFRKDRCFGRHPNKHFVD